MSKFDHLTGDPLPETTGAKSIGVVRIVIDGDYDLLSDEQKVEALAKKASPEAVQKIYQLMGSDAPGIALKACEAILAYAIGKPVERKQVMIMDRSKLLDECKELAEKMGYDTQHLVIDQ